MHNSHPYKCEHELKHCSQCDVAYCSKCKEEWKKNNNSFTFLQGQGSTTNVPLTDLFNGSSIPANSCH